MAEKEWGDMNPAEQLEWLRAEVGRLAGTLHLHNDRLTALERLIREVSDRLGKAG